MNLASVTMPDMSRYRLQQKGDLYQRAGRWMLRWREYPADGGPAKWSKSVTIGPCEGPGKITEKEARRRATSDYLSHVDNNQCTPMSMITVQDFWDRYFIPGHVAMKKTSTRLHYTYMATHVLPEIGEMQLREVKAWNCQQIISQRINEDYSTGTLTHIKNCISVLFNYAEKLDMLPGKNPARGITLPEMVRKPTHAMSHLQVSQLLSALNRPVREMILTSLLTSCNVAELCGLTWRFVNLSPEWVDIDGTALEPWSIAIRQQWSHGEYHTVKAKSRRRNIEMPEMLSQKLGALKASSLFSGPDDPVFSNRNGAPLRQNNIATRLLKPIGKKLGMPWLSWHAVRRTTATWADQFGASTSQRKGLLGHSTDRMATHYVQKSGARPLLEQFTAHITISEKETVN